MATIHRAKLKPPKMVVIGTWASSQPWYQGPAGELAQVGGFRFDDPEGKVGLETVLASTPAGRLLLLPMTYRDTPLAGAEQYLVGELDHSVLGHRWCYDGTGDPVWVAAVVRTILTGGTQARVFRESEVVPPTVEVRGSGTAATTDDVGLVDVRVDGPTTVVVTSAGELHVRRLVDGTEPTGDLTLSATWGDRTDPVVLMTLRP